MGRLLFYIVILSLGCKLVTRRWPWEFLAFSSTREQELERARRLLGVGPGASRSKIVEAHRRLIATVHPDRGGSSQQVHAANAARDLLLAQLPNA